MQIKVGFKKLVEEAEKQIRNLSPQEALELFTSKTAQFVDLRDIRELKREGMIPGAFHCPRGMLEFWIDPESPYHKDFFTKPYQFVFYCGGGWRSALAAQTAQMMGLENVAHIKGGFTAWKEMNAPVEKK